STRPADGCCGPSVRIPRSFWLFSTAMRRRCRAPCCARRWRTSTPKAGRNTWLPEANSLPAEDEAKTGLAAALADMGGSALTELKQSIAVAAALLVERAVMAVAFLMHDAEIVAAALHDTGDIADAVLADRAAFDFLDQ